MRSGILKLREWAEAELLLHENLSIAEKPRPDDWRLFITRSMIGEALLGQQRFDEAELLLIAAYEGMNERKSTIQPVH